MAVSRCEVCGYSYEEENINILGHHDDMWVVEVCCGSCHSQSLLAALIDEDSASGGVENLTDLTDSEIQLFKDIVITADDVLDMCIFLDRYRGDARQIFTWD